MNIILFSVCCMLATVLFYISSKQKIAWVKKSFIIYGFIFSITAISVLTLFVMEHKAAFKQLIQYTIPVHEDNQLSPEERKLSKHTIQKKVKMDVPKIEQLPELPRGCEVTSLSMLLRHNDIRIDKMDLAQQVKKDPTPYTKKDGEIFFGNPYRGFVGDMYSFDTPGMGVYHKPIAALAKRYAGDRVKDLTGNDFKTIITELNHERPVWVIINTTYDKLPESQFTTWNTKDGKIDITMKQHSVLITGYDENYIYFNDPLNFAEKAPIDEFQAAWEQMGKQAITID
ncbi:C39 family peptidase [Virgibacillus pantothenticus]|uniref:C39 family peptidase n=1 Tax=Virgibacillus pantothenticus TaxID=1473 RepID=UPI0020149843|nr:C39 family peptidase [Virgibacillus pantothenticus]